MSYELPDPVRDEDAPSQIAGIRSKPWPVNRKKGDWWTEQRDRAALEPLTVYCGWCGKHKKVVGVAASRAWHEAHKCNHLRGVA